jgi:hypothetical protein
VTLPGWVANEISVPSGACICASPPPVSRIRVLSVSRARPTARLRPPLLRQASRITMLSRVPAPSNRSLASLAGLSSLPIAHHQRDPLIGVGGRQKNACWQEG